MSQDWVFKLGQWFLYCYLCFDLILPGLILIYRCDLFQLFKSCLTWLLNPCCSVAAGVFTLYLFVFFLHWSYLSNLFCLNFNIMTYVCENYSIYSNVNFVNRFRLTSIRCGVIYLKEFNTDAFTPFSFVFTELMNKFGSNWTLGSLSSHLFVVKPS